MMNIHQQRFLCGWHRNSWQLQNGISKINHPLKIENMQLAYYIEDREGIITIEFSPSTSRNQDYKSRASSSRFSFSYTPTRNRNQEL